MNPQKSIDIIIKGDEIMRWVLQALTIHFKKPSPKRFRPVPSPNLTKLTLWLQRFS